MTQQAVPGFVSFQAPDGWPAAGPFDQQRIRPGGQTDVVGAQAAPRQEFEDVGGAEGAAEDLTVAADAASAFGVPRLDDDAQSRQQGGAGGCSGFSLTVQFC